MTGIGQNVQLVRRNRDAADSSCSLEYDFFLQFKLGGVVRAEIVASATASEGGTFGFNSAGSGMND